MVVVTDASIIIDLLIIEFVDEFFKLNFDFCTTDLIMGEIKEPNLDILNKYVKNHKIDIMKFSSTELVEIYKLDLKFSSLSLPDCSCIFACQKKNAMLLTGEKKLKKIVEEKGIKSHGILWIFNQLLNHKIVDRDLAIIKLRDLINVNPRLPKDEFKKFIKKIGKGIE